MAPKIIRELVNNELIILGTDDYAVCELSSLGMEKHKDYLLDHGIDYRYPLFFFNRIKATKERRGNGTILMKRLVEICDEKGLAIINPINPYGRMNLEELKAWFGNYGFFEVTDTVIVRFPRGR